MLRILSCLAVCLAPLQALALSCMPWQVENAYQQAQESDDLYVVVHGELSFEQAEFPVTDWSRQEEVPPETRLRAKIDGDQMGSGGARAGVSQDLTFVVTCAGPWCPQATSGETVLAFLRETTDGFALELGACGGMMFARPDDDMLSRAQTCLDGGACTAPELR